MKAGLPGRCNDSGAFIQTKVCEKADARTLFPLKYRHIHGVDVPYYLLGDSAFPLKSWLIKPYSLPTDPSDIEFNMKHSLARKIVECGFGRLKGRWRKLLYCLKQDLDDISSIVLVAFSLHNICQSSTGLLKTTKQMKF